MPMAKVTEAAVAAYEAAFPADERAVKKKMFGHPAAFVNGNMFFGTFADGLTFRLPADRLVELAELDGVSPFEPMPGRPWKEYVFSDRTASDEQHAAWALEALEHTAKMPPKKKKK